jgi:hypothetical protein
MSKRKRPSDGPSFGVSRPCLGLSSGLEYSAAPHGSILGKRASFDDVLCSEKRFRGNFLEELPLNSVQYSFANVSSSSSSIGEARVDTERPLASKRPAEFDNEIARLSKRLKASVPSAEEAIAFLLPHIENLRKLYIHERELRQSYEKKAATLANNNEAIKATLRDQLIQKSCVQRQLDLALYRLAMSDSGNGARFAENSLF